MRPLSLVFEEDIEIQDALEDLDTVVDDSEDIIIGAFEDRFNSANRESIFDNEKSEEELDQEDDKELMSELIKKDSRDYTGYDNSMIDLLDDDNEDSDFEI